MCRSLANGNRHNFVMHYCCFVDFYYTFSYNMMSQLLCLFIFFTQERQKTWEWGVTRRSINISAGWAQSSRHLIPLLITSASFFGPILCHSWHRHCSFALSFVPQVPVDRFWYGLWEAKRWDYQVCGGRRQCRRKDTPHLRPGLQCHADSVPITRHTRAHSLGHWSVQSVPGGQYASLDCPDLRDQ